MKQLLQNLRSGSLTVEDVPPPALRGPGVLIATACSLISPGTERATVELGRSSLLGKAMRRPDQVRKVLENMKREGVFATWRKVQQRLDVTRPLGYSCSGIVLESRDTEFRAGDRVACAGTDAATHAEFNFVPPNLCAGIPEGVGFDEAAFCALGGIALHAARLGGAQLGDQVAVLGLGPIGLLLAQILRASGCRVSAFDIRSERLKLANQLGIAQTAFSDPALLEETLRYWKIPGGYSHVFIAAASKSSAPVDWAISAAADRARMIVVGDVPTNISRNAAYAKELTVLYARSYGPGRHDAAYEEQGHDYPQAYVPWTLGRNLAAFLEAISARQVQVAPLITHRFPITEAARAYDVVSGAEPSLCVLLEYPLSEDKPVATIQVSPVPTLSSGDIAAGFIGAGNYATSYLLPGLKAHPQAKLISIASARGASAKKVASQFGFSRCSTEAAEILSDPAINTVFIATPHALHAQLALGAIEAGKAVFLEKPMCLTEEELDQITAAHAVRPVPFCLGHNRRFAPATRAFEEFFGRGPAPAEFPRSPLSIRYVVRANTLPPHHWLADAAQGGRILGEVCHFVDWCCHLVGVPVAQVFATFLAAPPDQGVHTVLDFVDGSIATIIYDTISATGLPKESIEVSSAGRTGTLEDFIRAAFFSGSGRRNASFRGKGQTEMLASFLSSLTDPSMPFPIPFTTWAASARVTLALVSSASSRLPIYL